MNCVLFAQTDQIFSKKKIINKIYKKCKKKHGKSQGNSGDFVSPEKWEP